MEGEWGRVEGGNCGTRVREVSLRRPHLNRALKEEHLLFLEEDCSRWRNSKCKGPRLRPCKDGRGMME